MKKTFEITIDTIEGQMPSAEELLTDIPGAISVRETSFTPYKKGDRLKITFARVGPDEYEIIDAAPNDDGSYTLSLKRI